MDVAIVQGINGARYQVFLMWWLYNQAMRLFSFALSLRAWWHPETRAWNALRKQHLQHVTTIRREAGDRPIVWMHCASLGEFEQGLPVLKMVRRHNEDVYLVVSFFSPSGYLQRKNTDHADAVIYLPIDTHSHATQVIQGLRPSLFMGVKYEFWWNYLRILLERHVPVVYLSVKLKPDSYLWTSRAAVFRKCMRGFAMIFTQDSATEKALKEAGISNVITAGDTRVSAVLDRQKKAVGIQHLEVLRSQKRPVMIYGSVYTSDLPFITEMLNQKDWTHIVVPHKVDKDTLKNLTSPLPHHHLWSSWNGTWTSNILVVDVLGRLFDLYAYADCAYIGGGFERSVHNTLEPATFGLPLAFGPKNKGFVETAYFLEKGIATEISEEGTLRCFAERAISERPMIQQAIESYFEEHSQAMMRIEDWFLKYYFK